MDVVNATTSTAFTSTTTSIRTREKLNPDDDNDKRDAPFPDDELQAVHDAGGKLDRDDWRRQNIDTLIKRDLRRHQGARSNVKFGISPFGMPRPGSKASST